MITRVARLVQGELIKLSSHLLLIASLVIIVLTAVAGAGSSLIGQPSSVWRPPHAIQLFAGGFDWGLLIAAFVLVIFSSMMFAGEFDRGTIKNLLTRPILRADLFAAKCVTVILLGIGLYLFTLYVSLAIGFAFGDLGPVWLGDQYMIQRAYPMIAETARKAVVMSFLPFLAAGFLGILVSNWTESSGNAVAIGLILFLFGSILTDRLPESVKRGSFFYYAPYVLQKLRLYAQGGNEYWDPSLEARLLHVKVPLAYIAGFLPPAFAIFLRRNITA